MAVTQKQCTQFLKEDLDVAAKEVARCVKTSTTQNQQNALISFTYNTGAICNTKIPKLLSEGNCLEAAKQFNAVPQRNKDGSVKRYNGFIVMQYTTSNGIPLRGLILRRGKERTMFESGCSNN